MNLAYPSRHEKVGSKRRLLSLDYRFFIEGGQLLIEARWSPVRWLNAINSEKRMIGWAWTIFYK
ncbi:hypothetical protein [Bradyrhizobium glycinis]|uniref:hypothetical protein n=1 Tax=Bradyrhizobium glycinis TaxID=2751812 RepID=UPI0018D8F350|nr:hypothetical protein [Bradyrhizobium glycinis]MBH5370952.1 hypothetical protein [Bradyrhizobium glycinis]